MTEAQATELLDQLNALYEVGVHLVFWSTLAGLASGLGCGILLGQMVQRGLIAKRWTT